MVVYLANIAFLIIGYLLWFFSGKFKKGKLYFCIQATIQWTIISGFRSLEVGADTGRYKIMFDQVKHTSWGELNREFLSWLQGADVKDPGYNLLQKIFQVFSSDYQLFLIFIALLFMIPLSVWLYHNSENILLSYILFSCLFYSFFAITGIRQTIVTGIMVFWGDGLLKKKKYFLYYLILILLIPIHKSVIVMAFVPFLVKSPINSKTLVGWGILIVGAYIFRSQLMSLLSGIIGYDQYDKFYEGAGASTFALLYYLTTIVAIVFYTPIMSQKGEGLRICYNSILVGAILLPLTFINQSAMRAVQYFSVYLMLFFPYVVNMFKETSEKWFLNAFIIMALIVLLIRNNPQYTFFWQI